MDNSNQKNQELVKESQNILPSAPPLSIVLKSYIYTDIKNNDNNLSREDLLNKIIDYYSKFGATQEEITNAITDSILELRLEYP